ncbi:MAG: erythromycin esterase [Flavobacterium psychrophilum]|nr:MAG: erythromycin esterase [Flavobacterium psychrophilum]
MRKLNLILGLFFLMKISAQDNKVISWVNSNAIVIEDANADNLLLALSKNEPESFHNARVFGFGEGTHNGKEFFTIKAKFFKYLVEHQGVRIFIMEENYQAEKGINEWISGGIGDKTSIVKNFRHYIWYTQEIANLLEWMRNYNIGKTAKEQIRFYGMDVQTGELVNKQVRDYIHKHAITVDDALLTAIDSCSVAAIGGVPYKKWSQKMLPKIRQLKYILSTEQPRLVAANASEYTDMMRALGFLEDYTLYISWPASGARDEAMYNNVLEILGLEGSDSKAFIWAHNEHINKKDLGSQVPNLGSRLKEQFKEFYYSMGFDFGGEKMKGYIFSKNQVVGSEYRILDTPYKKTYAETLNLADSPIYYIDIREAIKNPVMNKYFNTKLRQLFVGAPGFDPEKTTFFSRKYIDTYDGIIFIKSISPASPL